MKRSFWMSALVLAFASATAMAACGGGGSNPANPDDKKEGEESSGDPVTDLKNVSDGLQKDVDALFQPIKDADAVIDGVANLPKDLKTVAKKQIDQKKLMAEAQKIVDGADPNIDNITGEADAKAKIQERFDKLKALVTSIKSMDEKVKALPDKIADALKKVATTGPAAIAKAQVKMKAPFGVSDADKKKAADDIKTLEDIVKSFPAKADGWKKDITEIPAKAKDLPAKMSKAFKG